MPIQPGAGHFTVLIFALAATAGAQSPIPIRTIGPILATSTENVGPVTTVRGTSDGHAIVVARARQRVYAFDSTLEKFTLVVDSSSGTGSMTFRSNGLIQYLGDSTLLPDVSAGALLVLDATGKEVRSMAPPRPQDLMYMANVTFGHPALDRQGRLIYRTNTPPRQAPLGGRKFVMNPLVSDSSPIVRGDFDTRHVDTVAWVRTASPGRIGNEMTPSPAGGPPAVTMHMQINPFNTGDEWALLSDGTLGVVRVHDYHVDWVDPDGTKRSGPKMPTEWRKYTDAERTLRIDSVKHIMEESFQHRNPPTKLDLSFVSDSELPTFWPPLEPGSVLADLDAHLWILPRMSNNAGNGLTYDVVNRTGEIFERVQLPKDHVLVGFGPRNVVYLTKTDGKATFLVRALFRGPPK